MLAWDNKRAPNKMLMGLRSGASETPRWCPYKPCADGLQLHRASRGFVPSEAVISSSQVHIAEYLQV